MPGDRHRAGQCPCPSPPAADADPLLATVPQRTRSEEEGDALGQHLEEAKFSPRAAPVHVSVRERGRGRAGPG